MTEPAEKSPAPPSVTEAALKAARRLDQLASRPGLYRVLWVVDADGNRYLVVEESLKLEKLS